MKELTDPMFTFTRKSLLASFCFVLLALGLCVSVQAQSTSASDSAATVLIVADEFPAMQVLADRLQAEEKIASKIVSQKELPASFAPFAAVMVYIHRDLDPAAERAFIDYARGGGKLILLHHSISSGKRKNKDWFKFLGVELPTGDVDKGGYKWTEGITMDIVNLNPTHFITSNKITWPEQVGWKPAGAAAETKVPAVTLHESEVYLNHVLTGERTILLGLKYKDDKKDAKQGKKKDAKKAPQKEEATGKVYMQSHAGWVKSAGKGTVIYLLPGHSEREFKDPVYGRIVINAVIYKP